MLRCEDCLPQIEDYFDGEVDETAAARMGAHLSACATCAAALDALSFEQEIYARYDRRLETGPDLWARVSAEIARDARPAERQAPRRPFLSRVREGLAVSFGALAARPALASSFALLLVGLAVGSLWLARGPHPVVPSQVAQNSPVERVVVNAPPPSVDNAGVAPAERPSNDLYPAGLIPVTADAVRDLPHAAAEARRVTPGTAADEVDVETLLASATATQASPGIVVIRPDEHSGTDDTAALFVNASAPARELVAADARLLEPGEKELARHVEQAQMLLRSIKNARASEMGAVDIAYEKNLSRKLLSRNSTLQLAAEFKGDRETKQVLDSIEPFLLDIANLRENPSRDEVRSIRERVRQNEIVAALQVY